MKSIKKSLLYMFLLLVMLFAIPAQANAAVKISQKSVTLIKGQTTTLKITGTKSKVTWSSSKTSVATVSSKGKIAAKKTGFATITAKAGKNKYTCKVKVETPKISSKKLNLAKGKTAQLKVSGTSQKISWKSSNKKIATVTSKGVVKGIKAGNCKITATINGKKYACTVTVKNSTNTSSGSRENPFSAYTGYIMDVYSYSQKIGRFGVKLLDYKSGDDALQYVLRNDKYGFNDTPSASQEYIYVKFEIRYISGTKEVSAINIVNHYSDFYNSASNYQLDNIGWAYNIEDENSMVDDMSDVRLYPGGSAICSKAILIRSGNTPITYRIQTGFDSKNYEPIYTWFTTKK